MDLFEDVMAKLVIVTFLVLQIQMMMELPNSFASTLVTILLIKFVIQAKKCLCRTSVR